MRVDIVTDTFAPDINGVAMTLGQLADGLRRRGHLVHIIRSGAVDEEGQSSARSIGLPGYKEVRVGLPSPFKLRRRWARKRPDVIYVATESPLGMTAMKAAESLGIAIAAGFHTNFHHYVRQYRMAKMEPLAKAYLRHVHRRADVTLAPSSEVVSMLEEEGFSPVRLLGRGVDCNLFHPRRRDETLRRRWGAKPDSLVATVVGRVAVEKNLDLAIESFKRMRETVPDLQCVVVGDGPLRHNLESSHPWVHFAGMQKGEALARHYASSDVLLFPSQTETFGNVLLEGLASGLVTVSFDYAASAQHITPRFNGLKAPKGDNESYLQLAVEALSGNSQRRMRKEARHSVRSQSWSEIVDSFEAILRGVADKKRIPFSGHARTTRQRTRKARLSVRSVFISDVHLGMTDSKAREAADFLQHVDCDNLILNGDIIDGWALKRGGRWRKRHSRFIRTVLKKTEKNGTRVIYLRGNHDDILERLLPLQLGSVEIAKEYIHEGVDGKRYLVVHGDGFDSVSTKHRWLAVLGAIGYDGLLVINRWYNRWRSWIGKEYFSLSKFAKSKVKSAVSFVDRFQDQLQSYARKRGCDGIICGHIHSPEDKTFGDIRYLNSGDWVESLTAIVEHHDGRFEIISYDQFLRQMAEKEGRTKTTSSAIVTARGFPVIHDSPVLPS